MSWAFAARCPHSVARKKASGDYYGKPSRTPNLGTRHVSALSAIMKPSFTHTLCSWGCKQIRQRKHRQPAPSPAASPPGAAQQTFAQSSATTIRHLAMPPPVFSAPGFLYPAQAKHSSDNITMPSLRRRGDQLSDERLLSFHWPGAIVFYNEQGSTCAGNPARRRWRQLPRSLSPTGKVAEAIIAPQKNHQTRAATNLRQSRFFFSFFVWMNRHGGRNSLSAAPSHLVRNRGKARRPPPGKNTKPPAACSIVPIFPLPIRKTKLPAHPPTYFKRGSLATLSTNCNTPPHARKSQRPHRTDLRRDSPLLRMGQQLTTYIEGRRHAGHLLADTFITAPLRYRATLPPPVQNPKHPSSIGNPLLTNSLHTPSFPLSTPITNDTADVLATTLRRKPIAIAVKRGRENSSRSTSASHSVWEIDNRPVPLLSDDARPALLRLGPITAEGDAEKAFNPPRRTAAGPITLLTRSVITPQH